MSFLNRFLEEPPHDDLLQSVVRNLQHVLRARPGYGYRLREYGIADYLEQQGKKAAQLTILREIRDDITTMEPRLRVREITTIGRDAELWLHILVSGVLLARTGPRPCGLRVRFHLPTGEVRVEAEAPSGSRHGP